MFWTSKPGVTKKRYSSWGSEINFVYVRLLLSVNFPDMELRQSFERPRFAALYLIESLSSWMPSL